MCLKIFDPIMNRVYYMSAERGRVHLKKQNLYQFRDRRNKGNGWVIMPAKYVNESIIRECWDDLLRLASTIRLKEATASAIFGLIPLFETR